MQSYLAPPPDAPLPAFKASPPVSPPPPPNAVIDANELLPPLPPGVPTNPDPPVPPAPPAPTTTVIVSLGVTA